MLFQVNGTDMGEMKVLRGKKNHKDIAKVITFNGDPGDFSFMLLVHISVVQRKHVYLSEKQTLRRINLSLFVLSNFVIFGTISIVLFPVKQLFSSLHAFLCQFDAEIVKIVN